VRDLFPDHDLLFEPIHDIFLHVLFVFLGGLLDLKYRIRAYLVHNLLLNYDLAGQ
jgi:hypothetical protein